MQKSKNKCYACAYDLLSVRVLMKYVRTTELRGYAFNDKKANKAAISAQKKGSLEQGVLYKEKCFTAVERDELALPSV